MKTGGRSSYGRMPGPITKTSMASASDIRGAGKKRAGHRYERWPTQVSSTDGQLWFWWGAGVAMPPGCDGLTVAQVGDRVNAEPCR